MSGYTPFAFTAAQETDIRRYCGFPAKADGSIVFPAPYIQAAYLALEYRLNTLSQTEGAVIVTYLTTLNGLETAIAGAGANLDTDQAAVWYHNKNEVRDRVRLYNWHRRELCKIMGVPPGEGLDASDGSTMRLVV
jgi:hypothetical protein